MQSGHRFFDKNIGLPFSNGSIVWRRPSVVYLPQLTGMKNANNTISDQGGLR